MDESDGHDVEKVQRGHAVDGYHVVDVIMRHVVLLMLLCVLVLIW